MTSKRTARLSALPVKADMDLPIAHRPMPEDAEYIP
jgi:hypothetical protein